MNAKIFLLAGAALLVAQSAGAATTPKISGKYNFSMSEFCQPVIDPWPNGSSVLYDGYRSATTAVADFDSSSAKVSATGETLSGNVIVSNSAAGTMTASPYTLSGSYSNTATTLTLDGAVYQVDYKYVLKGLARSFHFYTTATEGGGVTAANCALEGNASMEK
ncbi:MAG TPA: hypothetical protein VMF67_12290 [Rhizomicrobium sp.]|nr:hypothetical protein [Rhizomicrobium sp.]